MAPLQDPRFWLSAALMTTKRNTLLVGWGECERVAAASDRTPTFYFPDFFLQAPHPWHQYEKISEIEIKEALTMLYSSLQDLEPPTLQWQQPSGEAFIAEVVELKKLIAKSALHKAVPYAMASSPSIPSQLQRKRSLATALTHYATYGGCCYGFWDDTVGEGLLGATPELLMAREGSSIYTVACAGTASSPELLYGAKEQHEHALVLDGIAEALAPYGTMTTASRRTLKAGALYHLLTPISILLDREVADIELIGRLHPTPALGAYPKERGSLWLRQYHEKYPRGRYGAPAGYKLPTRGEFVCHVAIRQMQWKPGGSLLTAGAGVTADSDPTLEWNEVLAKMAATQLLLSGSGIEPS